MSATFEDLMHHLRHRRSLGLSRLLPDPVDTEIVEKILEAANWAPSNGDTEPWRYTVFMGEGRNQLADIYEAAYLADHPDGGDPVARKGYRDRAMLAPLWIALGMTPALNEDGSLVEDETEELLAAACAAQNLHLAAAALGLAGMWHSRGVSVHPAVAERLGHTGVSRHLGFFFFGWPAEPWGEGERGPWRDKVTWVV